MCSRVPFILVVLVLNSKALLHAVLFYVYSWFMQPIQINIIPQPWKEFPVCFKFVCEIIKVNRFFSFYVLIDVKSLELLWENFSCHDDIGEEKFPRFMSQNTDFLFTDNRSKEKVSAEPNSSPKDISQARYILSHFSNSCKPKEKNEICRSVSTRAVKCDGLFFVLQHGFQYGFQHA